MSEEPIRLGDIVKVLEKREQYVEAFYYGTCIPLQLEAKHGIPFERADKLTVDEVIVLLDMPSIPLKYRGGGWTFYWGEEAFRNARDED